jgi:hypothetical protein
MMGTMQIFNYNRICSRTIAVAVEAGEALEEDDENVKKAEKKEMTTMKKKKKRSDIAGR